MYYWFLSWRTINVYRFLDNKMQKYLKMAKSKFKSIHKFISWNVHKAIGKSFVDETSNLHKHICWFHNIGTFYRHLIIQATRIVLSKVSQALKACNGSPMLLSALSVKNLFRLLIPIHKAFKDLVLAEALSMKMLNINFLCIQQKIC